MSLQDLILMLQQAGILVDQLMASVAPAVAGAGMQLWQGLALIVVVWTGAQMALSGHGVNMAAVVRMVIGLSIPLGMLQFYTAALPGTGRSVPDLITGMGEWLQTMIVADAGSAMLEQFGLALAAWREQFGDRGIFGGMATFGWNVVTDLPGVLDAAFDLLVTVALMMGLAIGLIVVFALGQAQVMWAQMALSIALLLGPVFIPWMVIPQLSFLFWGWLRTVLVYSLYGAVAGAVFRVVTELGVFVVQGWTGDIAADVEWAGPTGIVTAWRRSLVTIPYIVAAGLATLKVGELTQMLLSGSGNVGSGASGRAMQTATVARVAATGGL
ncbi:MAG: type IV secretion system protein [Acidobacteria bacterium]|nr:type IV secretion system protein [Acidobacteriota bacterium]